MRQLQQVDIYTMSEIVVQNLVDSKLIKIMTILNENVYFLFFIFEKDPSVIHCDESATSHLNDDPFLREFTVQIPYQTSSTT